MQSAKDALDRHALIILHEDHIQTGLAHIVLVVGLHKIAAVITVNGRLDDAKSLNTAHVFFYSNLSHKILP